MKTLSLFLFLLLLPIAFAPAIVQGCDYAVYADTQCTPESNIYCINFACTLFEGETESCNDSDGRNEFIQGTITFTDRGADGAFIESQLSDHCEDAGRAAPDCSGRNCAVREYYCNETLNESETYSCLNGCSNGKCIDETKPQSWFSVGGTINSELYEGISGSASDSQSGIDRVQLTIQRDSDSLYWTGSNWSNLTWLTAQGKDSWSYSFSFENFDAGTYSLQCRASDLQGNVQTEFGETAFNVVIEEISEEEGAGSGSEEEGNRTEEEQGAEEPGEIGEKTGESQEDFISDEELLQAIQAWSEGKLGETEQENDSAILELIDKWKNQ